MTISFMNSICDLLQKLDNLYVIQSEQQAEIVQSICNHIVIIGMTMFYQQSWCSNVEVEEKGVLTRGWSRQNSGSDFLCKLLKVERVRWQNITGQEIIKH